MSRWLHDYSRGRSPRDGRTMVRQRVGLHRLLQRDSFHQSDFIFTTFIRAGKKLRREETRFPARGCPAIAAKLWDSRVCILFFYGSKGMSGFSSINARGCFPASSYFWQESLVRSLSSLKKIISRSVSPTTVPIEIVYEPSKFARRRIRPQAAIRRREAKDAASRGLEKFSVRIRVSATTSTSSCRTSS